MNITTRTDGKISTADLLIKINQLRKVEFQNEIRQNDFMARVEDELSGDHYEYFVVNNPNGTKSRCAILSESQALIVGMRESKAVRRGVMDWIESRRHKFAVPQTMPEALRLAADLAEQVESQKILIEESRPAVEFVEQYVDSTGLITFRELCKTLGAKENAMRFFLIEKGIMYRRSSGKLLPYAKETDAGRMAVKTGTADNGHAYSPPMWTPKGVNWIAGLWGQHQAQLRMNGLKDSA